MFGKIQHFRADRNYGFIRTAERESDVFFNALVDFEGDPSLLKKGVTVEFSLRKFRGNDVAAKIRIVSLESDNPAQRSGVADERPE